MVYICRSSEPHFYHVYRFDANSCVGAGSLDGMMLCVLTSLTHLMTGSGLSLNF